MPTRARHVLAAACLLVAATATSAEAQDQATVSFAIFGDPAEIAAYQTLVDAFEQGHPDIRVDLQVTPGQDDYRQKLAADMAAGAPADVVLINYRNYGPYAANGLLEPLGPRLRASDELKEGDFYREALAPFTWNDELVCIPQNASSLVVYFNKELFDAAGLAYPSRDWTWDDFLAAAQALTRDTDGDGATDQFGLGTEASIIRLAPFVWQNGGDLVLTEEDGTPRRLALDEQRSRDAFEWFVDLQTTRHVVPDATQEAAHDSESRFLEGTTGMYLDSRRVVPSMREAATMDWDVALLPHREEAASILHSDAYCLTSAATDKDAAWELVEFANSVDGQAIIAGTGRTVPSNRNVAESDAFLASTPPASNQVFLDNIPLLRATPVSPAWPEVEAIADEELERAFYGQATVDEAIASMIARTTPLFAGVEEG